MFDTIVIAIGVLAVGAVLYSFGEYLWPTDRPSIRFGDLATSVRPSAGNSSGQTLTLSQNRQQGNLSTASACGITLTRVKGGRS